MSSSNIEHDLFTRWREGDSSAGNALVRLYDGALATFFRYKASAQEAEDLKQDVWSALLTTNPPVVRSLRAYLFTIARNLLFHYCKCKMRYPAWDPLTTSLADLNPPLSQQIEQKLGAQDLRVTLRSLPLEMQILLELRYMHEMSTDELSETYDVPTGTIKSRLFHARKALQTAMPHTRHASTDQTIAPN